MRTRYVLACLTSCWVVAGQQPECTAEENGYYYDLSPLKAKEDYSYKSDTGREFKLNICASVASETWKLENPTSVGGFYRGSHSDISIGCVLSDASDAAFSASWSILRPAYVPPSSTVNTTLRIADSHPLLILSNGSPCSDGNSPIRASTAIRFICDNDVFGAGKPQLITQLPPDDESSCAFLFEWRTHLACPTVKPSRAGGIIAVIAVIALILFLSYIIAGVLYRRFALGYRGIDQLPRISIIPLSSLPHSLEDALDWLRDIRDHIRGGARDLWPRSSSYGSRPSHWGSRRSAGFDPLAREEEEAMFRDGPETHDPRFSIEDDADREGAQELTETSPPTVPAKDKDKPQGGGAVRL